MTMQKRLIRILGSLFLLSILWWAFTEGSVYQVWLGLIVVAIAAIASYLKPGHREFPTILNGWVLPKFIGYFVYESLKGGFFVAKLAFLPRRFIRSVYFEYKVSIPREAAAARMVFASCLCLFPGTLSCGYKGGVLVIHVLDTKLLDVGAVRRLEEISALLFKLNLPTPHISLAN